jgi:alpha-amylase
MAAALTGSAPGCGPVPTARRVPAPVPEAERPDPGPPWANQWARGQVFYEVFVRSFADSDGDGVGDLRGLIAHLDDLNDGDPGGGDDLGVDALWLMPVFDSPSYHGYDVTDYRAINPDYGTLGDFQRLLQEAHRRGMRVIVDLVLNHTSAAHPWFVASSAGPTSPRRTWYTWRPDDPGWTRWDGQPTWSRADTGDDYFFTAFGRDMPDLNHGNPEVRAEIEAIARLWLDLGVDGFRLDAAPLIMECGVVNGRVQFDCPETHEFWRGFSRFVRGIKPEALLIGEAWTHAANIAPYFGSRQILPGGDELTSSFDFPLAAALIEALRTGNADPVRTALAEARRLYPAGALDAPFLTNHDQLRLASALASTTDTAARLRQAPALLLTLPGAPFLYYGEEVGLGQSVSPGDLGKRAPMPWDGSDNAGFTAGAPWAPLAPGWQAGNVAAQRATPGSLWHTYRRWIAARHASPALRDGDLEPIALPQAPPALLGFVRRTDAETALVLHNIGDAALEIALPPLAGAPRPLAVDAGVSLSGGRAHLPAHSSAVWVF